MWKIDVKSFQKNTSGATMIEFTLVVFLVFSLLFGIIELTYYFYQYNAVQRAAFAGLRIAAISSPIPTFSSGTSDYECAIVSSTYPYTVNPTPTFPDRICTSSGCTNSSGFDSTIFNRIYARMKRYAPFLQTSDITISYYNTGNACAPTLTLSINRKFSSFSGLFKNLYLPQVNATNTGEDLKDTAP